MNRLNRLSLVWQSRLFAYALVAPLSVIGSIYVAKSLFVKERLEHNQKVMMDQTRKSEILKEELGLGPQDPFFNSSIMDKDENDVDEFMKIHSSAAYSDLRYLYRMVKRLDRETIALYTEMLGDKFDINNESLLENQARRLQHNILLVEEADSEELIDGFDDYTPSHLYEDAKGFQLSQYMNVKQPPVFVSAESQQNQRKYIEIESKGCEFLSRYEWAKNFFSRNKSKRIVSSVEKE